jgi:uncharacterized OB-fold protein
MEPGLPQIEAVATYLPTWGSETHRLLSPDEDTITMAVAAGRTAIADAAAPGAVVLVTRDFPVIEGGSELVLLAGLDLPADTRCQIVLGGGPQLLDALGAAESGTLVVGAETGTTPGAAAALAGEVGATVTATARAGRNIPVRVRDTAGAVFSYHDPRLLRDRGVAVAMADLGLDAAPVAVAGLAAKDAATYLAKKAEPLPTIGASSPLFAIAAALETGESGLIVAVEQAIATAIQLTAGPARITRREPAPRPLPQRRETGRGDIRISLPAYDRAFDGRLRLRAGRCTACGQLDLPQRYRCSSCGSEDGSELAALPRTATVYTSVSVHVPVPGLLTPYDIAIVDLGDTDVRLLAPVTDAEPGTAEIGVTGSVVLRRISVRNGVPDYGYAFIPDLSEASS